jgi:hypothetical protein
MEQGKGKVRLYGCGGLGVNVALRYLNRQSAPGFADLLPSFVDTSRSNLTDTVKEEDVFILEKTDGSGKVRKENHAQISAVIKQILLKQAPEDFNIVVFSASGGSGSVIGPLLAKELADRGHSVVIVSAGSSEAAITARNTLNTVKSLSAITKQIDKPLVAFYRHNGGEATRKIVDDQLDFAISCLCYLASRQNAELDTKDIYNWLNINKSTSVEAQLVLLDIFAGASDVSEIADPISIASLYADRNQPHLETPVPEYSCTGYFLHPVKDIQELHFVVSTQHLGATFDRLQSTINDFEQRSEGRAAAQKLINDAKDTVTDDGLVL